ncbi:MAG: hypothetical protein WCI09_01835 [Planctomycetota bacterium]
MVPNSLSHWSLSQSSGCLFLIALCLWVAGCSTSTNKKTKKGSTGGAAEKLPVIDADTAIAIDAGRITVASPVGWTRSPKSKDYLVRYQPGAKKTFPSIVVTADDALAGFTEITTENQPQFVEAIATDLAATFSKEGKSSLLKKPTAVSLGSHLGVSWAAPGTAKVGGLSENLDRLLYAVVIGGRLYTVEVRAPKGKLDDTGRAAAKAVAIALTASGGGAVDGPPDPEAVPDA